MPRLITSWGYAFHQLRRYGEAVSHYQMAIQKKPDYGLAYYNLGITYKALGNRNGVMEQYRGATTHRCEASSETAERNE